MSLFDTFDLCGEEIIRAKDNVKPVEDFPKTVIVVFSAKFLELFLHTFSASPISALAAGGMKLPVYQFEYKNKRMGFFHTLMGGAASAALLEELIALGAENILYFGSCGALDKEIAAGNLLVPTAAYRDEGVSYHYAAPSDYLEIATAPELMRIFDELHLPYRPVKTWTTDAFYRETQRNAERRKAEGCCTVEMECASVMAVGQFRGKKVCQFLYAADCLSEGAWDKRILGSMPADLRERILIAAAETACRL